MIFPIVKYVDELSGGANGRNWPGFVQVRRDAPYRAAVVAQEAWEAMFKTDPAKLWVRLFNWDDENQRELEYMGHECEIQAKRIIYGLPEGSARRVEAASMRNGYDGLFKPYSVDHIAREMLARRPKAMQWVREYETQIRKHK